MERDFTILFRTRPSFAPSPSEPSDPPLISLSTPSLATPSTPATILVREPRKTLTTSSDTSHTFHCDSYYPPSSTTDHLFTSHIAPLIPFVLSGGHATVLAYGQTGSGKTHTLSSLSRLAIDALYSSNTTCDVGISAIEIYGKSKINDLFDPTNARVVIGESLQGSSVFSRATVKSGIKTASEMVGEVEKAWSCRVTRGTEKNPVSSRSHALIRVVCERRGDKNSTPGVLQLVDLAGSERAADHSQVDTSKERIAETVAINTSLMTLKECIRARTSPSTFAPPHIPFRSSKLTLALKEAFDLYSRQPTHTIFIATASPDLQDLPATLNTFRYASALLSCPGTRIELKADKEGRNVFFWTPSRLAEWLTKYGAPLINSHIAEAVVDGEDGSRFSKCPEQQFYERVKEAVEGEGKKWGAREEKVAKELYLKWWKIVIASRTLSQKALEAEWKERQAQKKVEEEREVADDAEVRRLMRLPGIRAAPGTAAV